MSSEKRFMDFVKDKQRVGVTDEDAREKVSFRQMDPNGTSCYFLLWDYYRVWHSQSNVCLSDECVLSCCLQWKKLLYLYCKRNCNLSTHSSERPDNVSKQDSGLTNIIAATVLIIE